MVVVVMVFCYRRDEIFVWHLIHLILEHQASIRFGYLCMERKQFFMHVGRTACLRQLICDIFRCTHENTIRPLLHTTINALHMRQIFIFIIQFICATCIALLFSSACLFIGWLVGWLMCARLWKNRERVKFVD